MSCETKISANFIQKCGLAPKQGLTELYLGNHSEIDTAALTYANRNTTVTNLALKAGGKIFSSIGTDINQVNHALVSKDFGVKAYTHTANISIKYRGQDARERIQELVDGGRVFAIVKKIDKGEAGELSYEILGLESGMLIINDDWNSNENSGVATLIVATKEGEEEATGAKLFLDTDLATTEAWIDTNLFVPA